MIDNLLKEIGHERSVLVKGNSYYLYKIRKKVKELLRERFWLRREIENRNKPK